MAWANGKFEVPLKIFTISVFVDAKDHRRVEEKAAETLTMKIGRARQKQLAKMFL
jgi:hypothetical protein